MKQQDNEDYVDEIRSWLSETRTSQAQLARKVPCRAETVSHWLCRRTKIAPYFVNQLRNLGIIR